ncbi:YlbD family protein [Halalkalibacter kiskunsagensis]|uniref:YlbD family protein n=1 Tax=Halalkalibacter kiskunsagensis TaxID=1548599 RepID=A0ABV6KI94_9BACI
MESKQGLHPSVKDFKQFMKEHPFLAKEVKDGRRTLQELFEEWSVLGGDHEQWSSYNQGETTGEKNGAKQQEEAEKEQSSQSATDALGQIMGIVKRMNVQDLQNHLSQFSSVLSNVQNVIQSFQKQPENQQNHRQPDHPFSFRRD